MFASPVSGHQKKKKNQVTNVENSQSTPANEERHLQQIGSGIYPNIKQHKKMFLNQVRPLLSHKVQLY